MSILEQLNLGEIITLFDAHASSTGNSSEYSLPARAIQLTWQTSFGTAPASVTLQLQTSLDDINWSTIDTSTVTTGESRTINTSAVFCRARINAISGGTAITVKLIAKAVEIINTDDPTFNDVIINNDLTVSGDEFLTGNLTIGENLLITGTIDGFTFPTDGDSGQVLSTNGLGTLSFIDVSSIPPSTGANKILYDNGIIQDWSSNPVFENVQGTPNFAITTDTDGFLNFISDTYISFQAETSIVFNTGGIPDQLLIGDGNDQVIAVGNAAALTIKTQNVTGSDNANNITIQSGGADSGTAGNINILGGLSSSGAAGSIALSVLDDDTYLGLSGTDGIITFRSRNNLNIYTNDKTGSDNVGNLTITAGNSVDGQAGRVFIDSGIATGTGAAGTIQVTSGDRIIHFEEITGAEGIISYTIPNLDDAGGVVLQGGVSDMYAGAFLSIFGGSPDNAAGGLAQISGGTYNSINNGANLTLYGGTASSSGNAQLNTANVTDSISSGNIRLIAGNSVDGNTGAIIITGGSSSGSGFGGYVNLSSGNAINSFGASVLLGVANDDGPGNGALINLTSGGGTVASGPINISNASVTGSANSGTINIIGGNSVDGAAGSINLTAGTASGIGEQGAINLNAGGGLIQCADIIQLASHDNQFTIQENINIILDVGSSLIFNGPSSSPRGTVLLSAGRAHDDDSMVDVDGPNIYLIPGIPQNAGANGAVLITDGSTGWRDVHAANFVLESSSLRSNTTNANTGSIQVYDVDGAAYRDFLTWTNGNTPSVIMNSPTGGTLSIDANEFKSGGTPGVDASIIIPLVGTITISKGIVVGFA